MEKKTEDTILAFAEWLSTQSDTYMILAKAKDENKVIYVSDDNRLELAKMLTSGALAHKSLAEILKSSTAVLLMQNSSL